MKHLVEDLMVVKTERGYCVASATFNKYTNTTEIHTVLSQYYTNYEDALSQLYIVRQEREEFELLEF